jgi:uncharacterized protein YhbP (UPF0306 family)
MPIERSNRRIAAGRIATAARRLLEASTLCAVATVVPGGRAHVHTAYFAWSSALDLVWLSEPRARHSRNIRANSSAAIAVFESGQTWGEPDRGIQLFGRAVEVDRTQVSDAAALYEARFPTYRQMEAGGYRFYVLRPRRLKLFDEQELGAGVFVTARLAGGRRVVWERTDIYRPAA